ncbi:MAG: Gfo/Idh/MocA family oxidoreductase [Planctomycetota bacterium]
MSHPPLRVGLVGARFAANLHLHAYRRVYGVPVEIVGVTSRSAESRERFASENGLRAFDSLESLIEAVDVLDVCAPPDTHVPCAVAALEADKHVIIEKPLTGAFGSGEGFDGWKAAKEPLLEEAMEGCRRLVEAEAKSRGTVGYAENWVYAPAIQKEAEVLRKSGGHILWLHGCEAHSGSHSPTYGIWARSGGGSIVGKGCHPLTAALYLKRVEGLARDGRAIRPQTVSARAHRITALDSFRDLGHLRKDYDDVEDMGSLHVTFDDGTVADIFSNELTLGGVHNWLSVFADNHRAHCHLNPNDSLEMYNPKEEYLEDVYVVEKIGTKQGWSRPSPDEDWFHGFPHEIRGFLTAFQNGETPESDLPLGVDTVAVMYAGYVSIERRGQEVDVPNLV